MDRKTKTNTLLIKLGSALVIMVPAFSIDGNTTKYFIILYQCMYIIGCIMMFLALKEYKQYHNK